MAQDDDFNGEASFIYFTNNSLAGTDTFFPQTSPAAQANSSATHSSVACIL
jgi:hypothetical protein